MKGRVLKGLVSQRKCIKGRVCKSGNCCWCCASPTSKACWNELQSCIRNCVPSSSHRHIFP
ncbi:hypothetical protein PHJA_002336000 [Phtheirospermum japonicum]|uniref:Uncharacterized protein n=1 Tax=Phtheirospermum japonicum TaxID=374723 RepID=A0A830CPW3_9LAMI|nr:hypothetical protein PHJA_002336000 [Phtheirospermum japonicum]